MKKTLIVTLALVFALAVGQTAFAAPSAFSDVPAKHWAYGALSKLTKDGVLQGYPDGTFKGDKVMSRYEMAIVVARAVTKEDKANAEDRELIQKLESEFHSELDSLNARVDTLEKRVDALTYHGQARVRFDKAYFPGVTTDGNGQHINLDVNWGYQVNDRWSIKAESEYGRTFNHAGENETLQNSVAEQLYVTGPVGGATVKGGRYSAYSPYGLVYDDKVTGAEVSFGKGVKFTLQAGKATSTDQSPGAYQWVGPTTGLTSGQWVLGGVQPTQDYEAILIAAPIGKNSNIQAGDIRISNLPYVAPQTYVNYYTFSYDTKFGADWSFAAAYAKSNADVSTPTSAWLAKVQYKGADLNVPGTYDIYAEYRRSPLAAQYSNTDDWIANSKGTRIGFDYTLDKNITFLSWYTFGKDVDLNTKANMFRTQLNFNF